MKYETIKWEINRKCNLSCPYCCLSESKGESPTLEMLRALMDKFYSLGVKNIDFFGKEPLIDETVFDLMGYSVANDYGFKFTLITNGVNLTKYRAKIIDYAEPGPLVGVTMSFAGTMEDNTRNFVPPLSTLASLSWYVDTSVSVDITKNNVNRFNKSILEPFKEWELNNLYVKPIIEYDRNGETAEHAVTPSQYMNMIYNDKHELPEGTVFDIPRDMVDSKAYKDFPLSLAEEYGFILDADIGCEAGKGILYVDADGRAYGCGVAALKNTEHWCGLLVTPDQDIPSFIPTNVGPHCL